MATTGIDTEAPVVSRAESLVQAPRALVWEILCDLNRWPRWNKSIKRMYVEGPIDVGTEFRWTAGYGSIRSCFEVIEPPRRVVWTGWTFGIDAVHEWDLLVADGGTLVRTAESFSGPVARTLSGLLRRTLDKALEDGIASLRAEAERRAEAARP